MFRTLVINRGEKISCRDNWLVVASEEGERRVPIEDIYSIVIDNRASFITIPTITRLTENGTHILVCDEAHKPVSVILPQNRHYRPLNVIRKQLEMEPPFRNALWDEVIKGKIRNQAKVLSLAGGDSGVVSRIYELAEEVEFGDEGNREAIAAKMFFRGLYGAEFIRFSDNAISSALNYGYAIIRSSVAKTLAAYGYNCVIGIHHINESNPFNLADDIMEPLRPVIDLWCDENNESLVDDLTKGHRNALAAIVNNVILWNGKKMKIRNAIDKYVSSLTSAIEKHDPSLLRCPEIIAPELYNEEDD